MNLKLIYIIIVCADFPSIIAVGGATQVGGVEDPVCGEASIEVLPVVNRYLRSGDRDQCE